MIVGVVCPLGGRVPADECLQCADDGGGCGWTTELLQSVFDGRSRSVSVTQLVGCLRQAALQARVAYYARLDVQSRLLLGRLAHDGLASLVGPGSVVERRFEREAGGIVVVGRVDQIVPERRLLRDWKTTERLPAQVAWSHARQLQAYRWLVAPTYPIDRLEVVYLTRGGVRRFEVEVEPLEAVEAWVAERARALVAEELPPAEGGPSPAYCKQCEVREACAKEAK